MSEFFTVYLIAMFIMLIVIFRTVKKINDKQKKTRHQNFELHKQILDTEELDEQYYEEYFAGIAECEAELQRLEYYKVTAYIVAFTLTYCIIDCLLFNI